LTVDLHTPKVCRLVDEIRRRRELAGLGPDPLRDDADPERAGQNVLAHPGTIGEALLDQSRVAGIGNVYRAEVLFACGIHPLTPAAGLSSDDWDRIWACAVEQLHAGVHNRGDIVTVDPTDRATRDGRKTWVYRQRLCARCGSAVRTWDLGGRVAFACETCQPPPVPS
jgi:endonuclease-8